MPWAPADMGNGALPLPFPSPGKVVKCLVHDSKTLSGRTIYALFSKHLSACPPDNPLGVLFMDPTAGDVSLRPLNLSTPGKDPADAHVPCTGCSNGKHSVTDLVPRSLFN